MANGSTIELLTADAEDLALGAILGPQWGIYYQGNPVIYPASIATQIIGGAISGFLALPGISQVAAAIGLPNIIPVTASMIDFEYKQDWPISNYPQEQGAFQSYDKVTLPFDVRLKLATGGTASNRQAFLNAVFAIAGGTPPGVPLALPGSNTSLPLFDVITPDQTYLSCSCTHVDFSRNAKNGVTLIVVDMWFQQIAVTSTSTFQNTQTPVIAGQQSIGNVQPVAPSQGVQQAISGGAIY